ncbi:MAG: methyl-accepting chemotaxis protein, partial [Ramlibacter sp.]|nr:methyl-accepting chemotaxis protein [Ramlibacter sp.]
SSVKQVTDLIAEIAAASQEQSSGIEQVNTAVNQMDQVVQQNASLVEEATAATESMKEQAGSLLQTVSRFKLGADHEDHAVHAKQVMPAPLPQAARPAPRVVASAASQSVPIQVQSRATLPPADAGLLARIKPPHSSRLNGEWKEF